MAETGIGKLPATREPLAWRTQLVHRATTATVVLLLAAVFLLPRLVSLGGFVTADEPTWGKRAANFYYAIKKGQYAGTYQTGHPGVITMWAGAIAYQIEFPSYAKIGQPSLGDTKLLAIFMNHSKNPIELLGKARLVVLAIIALTTGLTFWFVYRLFGTGLAVFSFLLIAFEPLYVAHSRVLHTNGLLATFMFLSLVAYLYYQRTRSAFGLFTSGAGAGLSVLSLNPGIVLVPVIGLITLVDLWDAENRRFDLSLPRWVRNVAIPLLAWSVAALLVVFLVWPSMWGDPVGTLSRMLQYGLSAAEGDIGSAHLVAAYQDTELGSNYPYFYPLTYLWRSTPVVLAGLALALYFLIFNRSQFPPAMRRNGFALIAFILLYGIVMTFGEKKYDRYFLPAYLPLDLIATAGWVAGITRLADRGAANRKRIFQIVMAGILISAQMLLTLQHAPYYFTYFNPLLGGLRKAPTTVTVGWGEGLSEAALYLSRQPGACESSILSWYPLAFSWYSISFGCESEMVEFSPEMTLQDYLKFDYIVVYINQLQRRQPADLLDYLEKMQPLHSVRIKGVEFVRIYKIH